MRHFLKLVFVAAIVVGSAVAQTKPLIGSSDSFLKSGYCKTFACRYAGKIPITKSLDEYRYVVLYREGVPNYLNISAFRQGDTVVSVGLAVDGQDIPFSAENPKDMLPVLDLFRVATGVGFSATAFLNLQNSCDHVTAMLGAFKITCSTSSDTFDTQRWNYRIFR